MCTDIKTHHVCSKCTVKCHFYSHSLAVWQSYFFISSFLVASKVRLKKESAYPWLPTVSLPPFLHTPLWAAIQWNKTTLSLVKNLLLVITIKLATCRKNQVWSSSIFRLSGPVFLSDSKLRCHLGNSGRKSHRPSYDDRWITGRSRCQISASFLPCPLSRHMA